MLIKIILVVLMVAFIAADAILILTGTQIGAKGRRNVILQNIFCIIEAVLLWVFVLTTDTPYAISISIFGAILCICGAIGLRGISKESSDDLVTEYLTDIKITSAGHRTLSKKLEGLSDGKPSWFMLRGADKAIADTIKGSNRVTVVYHKSNRRIESISL